MGIDVGSGVSVGVGVGAGSVGRAVGSVGAEMLVDLTVEEGDATSSLPVWVQPPNRKTSVINANIRFTESTSIVLIM